MARYYSAERHPQPCVIFGCTHNVDPDRLVCRSHRDLLLHESQRGLGSLNDAWENYLDNPLDAKRWNAYQEVVAGINRFVQEREGSFAQMRR